MQEFPKKLIVLGGPTASGKTKLAIELAKALHTEIINADSRQFYQEMSIGTAVPSAEELAEVKHHFIQSHSAETPLSAMDFEEQAMPLVEELFKQHDYVIVCGGSGLYLQALAEGLDPLPPADLEYREQLEAQLAQEGVQSLAAMLMEKDPEKAASMDLKNPRRVIRALEILAAPPLEPASPKKERTFQIIPLFLNLDREQLYQRIDDRVDQMMEQGLYEEAQGLLPLRDSSALQTVGYRELFDHFDGKMDLETTVAKIKQHTRNYAKRQLTWFRNKGNYQEVQNAKEALQHIRSASNQN
ncbi:MAG: tRNA (adenosine(37)-N6)-dimethylallyltransferase MiaA [Bacteroidota bacterium]|nr:tRNA (adenosine(37)-N6)-dimethylallyltransferase MiaA [Bacteroidota bacterium]MDX5431748.1 tRNA (adenosine(37)-N6)-dimethylallyltransferase MiaA [Bacteroidota bacterium]MDX5470463.1 tRNA (adenosine(37)-N6)-dimethylallyltransferase MiaA [Bacteroidota bacterium]